MSLSREELKKWCVEKAIEIDRKKGNWMPRIIIESAKEIENYVGGE